MNLTPGDKTTLLKLARDSITHGMEHGVPLPVSLASQSDILQQPGASFVTLHLSQELRGCIGSLTPHRPLIQDVAQNAFSAAFRDPRFTPVRRDELDTLHIHIEVLSPTQLLQFGSETELQRMIRPGVDGLVMRDGVYSGTFLPSVWQSLPDVQTFLQQLKRKAGLPGNYWSDSLEVERYTTESFEEPVQE